MAERESEITRLREGGKAHQAFLGEGRDRFSAGSLFLERGREEKMEHLLVKGKAGERVLGRAYGFGFHGESEEGRKGRGLAAAA